MTIRTFVLTCVLVVLSFSVVADEAELKQASTLPRRYVACRNGGALSIDGKLDEPEWQAAQWTEEFADIEGFEKPKPRFRTRAKMLWDDRCLYIAVELMEPHVHGALTVRDSVIFQDNDFEVFLDPDGDGINYGEFEINALNTGWDLRLPKPYRDGGEADDGWTIEGLQTAVHVRGTLNNSADTDEAWTVELAIPWKGLAALDAPATPVRKAKRSAGVFVDYDSALPVDASLSSLKVAAKAGRPPRDSEHWRLNFSRVEWQYEVVNGQYRKVQQSREDNWVWSPQGKIDMHAPETWGYVEFSEKDVTAQAGN